MADQKYTQTLMRKVDGKIETFVSDSPEETTQLIATGWTLKTKETPKPPAQGIVTQDAAKK